MNEMTLFCETCRFSLDYRLDYSHYARSKCCRNCAMQWAEPHFEKWNLGWRPDPAEIDKYRNNRILLARHAKRKKYDIREG